MVRRAGNVTIVIETPRGVGFRGQVKTLLAWLDGLPKHGALSVWLGTGALAGAPVEGPKRSGNRADADVGPAPAGK